MRLTRRQFLILAGISAVDVILETQGYGVGAFIVSSAHRLYETYLTPASLRMSGKTLNSVYCFFDPSLRPYLKSIPIISSKAARTAYASVDQPQDKLGFIAVSPDFFSVAQESKYWDDYYSRPPYNMSPDQPVFSEDFRMQLLAHEFLHIAQAHLQIDTDLLFSRVAQWYTDEAYGRPTPGGCCIDSRIEPNWTKYVLWWNLYGHPGNPDEITDSEWKKMEYCERYARSPRGVEEFAYVGETIMVPAETARRKDRLFDLSSAIYDSYVKIIDPSILALRC
jgi:hypothetical protein